MTEQLTFDLDNKPPIKGFPELRWTGKRPYRTTQFYPAQLRERYGIEQPFEKDGKTTSWINKLFWGDNLQVMSHLLKDYRGQIDLIYIDPPFDSKADYKKKIALRGQTVTNDSNAFEEKQYGDIWTNDEYLQFMYERLLLLRELLTDTGFIALHCDWHKNYLLRCILDEVFGNERLINEIVWRRKGGTALGSMNSLSNAIDTIYLYSKTPNYSLNPIYAPASQEYIDMQFRHNDPDGRRYMITVMRSPNPRPNLMYDYKGYKMPPNGWAITLDKMKELDEQGYLHFPDSKSKQIYKKIYLDEYQGQAINNLWTEISTLKGSNSEIVNYPTQKPEELVARIINLTTKENDLVLDCFMGSGTTQSVAMKLGRRFIGADINLGAIHTTTKRLISVSADIDNKQLDITGDEVKKFTGFEVYNVNNYEFFRNPVEARQLILEMYEVQPFSAGHIYDGELDGRMVKVMPVNRIATPADLEELKANLPYQSFEKRREENPGQAVEKLTIICMGHTPDLRASLEMEFSNAGYKVDIEVVDILRDPNRQFKRGAEADVAIEGNRLVIRQFYPLNLMQKLSLGKEFVEDWKQLAESVMIDWNFDGVVMEPSVTDVPGKNEMVQGIYDIPPTAGTIKVKITDLLSESLEVEVRA